MKEKLTLSGHLPSQVRKILPVYITFMVFLVLTLAVDPQLFSNYHRLWAISLQFAPLMLCAMSQTACMLVGGINLALGTAMSLMTTICATTMGAGALGIARGVLCTVGGGALVGLIMGAIVVYGRLPDIIVTLAFSYIWKGVALIVLPSPGGYVDPAFTSFMNNGGIFPPAILIVGLMLILWKIFKTTKPGLNIYAVGGNAKASYEIGLNVKKTKITAYLVSGVLLGVAGVVLSGQISSGDPTIGTSYQMNSIAAAVLGGVSFLGGIGQMKGAIMGAFIFTALVNLLFFSGMNAFWQYVAQGMILIAAIGLQAISYYRKGGDRA
ncbi:MAG: ABC transporter permease [Eubacteriales bacterium]|nr:ABC transporter permease [Eubacteriales bacterium]